MNVIPVSPWLKHRDLQDSDYEDLGFNTTLFNNTVISKLPLEREGTQYYLEDQERELCHKLNLRLDKEELASYDEGFKEFCANALVTDEPSPKTGAPTVAATDVPSRNTLSVLGPTSTLMVQKPTGLITMTRTAPLARNTSF